MTCHKILLVGPKINVSNKRAYGGGSGGYTRNMKVYLKYFNSDEFDIIPCFHSIRGEINLGILNGPLRIIYDLFIFLKSFFLNKINGVHILAQYRGAIARELLIVLFANFLQKPVLYEIKAGSFESSYNSKNGIYKFCVKYILNNSKVVLVEGKPYLNFLKNTFNIKSEYFPNVIPNKEIIKKVPQRFKNHRIKLLFVGYAYEGKGVFELYDACNKLYLKGFKIILTIVGELHDDFVNYIKKDDYSNFLNIKGKLNHNQVLIEFKNNDIYCYPSKHPGEGHNNTINEALMSQIIICSTLNGFLGSFINEKNSFPLKKVSAEVIYERIKEIIDNKGLAIEKSILGRNLILRKFNTYQAKKLLIEHYKTLIKQKF